MIRLVKRAGRVLPFAGHGVRVAAVAAVMSVFGQLASAQVSAQTDPERVTLENVINDTEVLYFGNGEVADSSAYRTLLENFYEDQFRHIQDPRAPYFMLMSRSGNIGMGIGGDLKLIGSYDFDGSQDGPAFIPYNIPIPKNLSEDNLLQFTPNRTAIFFSIFGNSARLGKFQIYVEAKFNGQNNAFKMSKAYATVGDWTFGYNKSTFCDPAATPATVETEGPNSNIDDTRMLVRYMHSAGKGITLAASVECPDNNVPTSAYFRPKNNSIPDFAAFVQYAAYKQHIRLSAIVRALGYTDLVKMDNRHTTGWGVNLSMKLRPADPLTIYVAVNTGRGIGSMVNDLAEGDNDLLGCSATPGKMYAPKSWGCYGALQYNFTPDVYSTVIVSRERLCPKSGSDYSGTMYKYGLYGTANVFWSITPRMQVGAEFNAGRRMDMDGTHRNGYRVSALGQFSF